MKYVSLIIFAVALAWTWNIVHSTGTLPFETHNSIQEGIAHAIVETVKAKRPMASEVVVEKVWTEAVDAKTVRASFNYSFKDNSEAGPVTTQIHGQATLKRTDNDEETGGNWKFTEVHTDSDSIEFSDATIITGSPNGSPDVPADSNSEATPAPAGAHGSPQPEHSTEH